MGKKHKFNEEEIPEATQPPSEEETSPQTEAADGTDNLLTQNQSVTGDFEWDCGDTRYNIGDKVFRHGDRLSGVPVDDDGSPSDRVLKAAYKSKYLKRKE